MTARKPLLALSALALIAAAPAAAEATNVVPRARVAAADLEPEGYHHHDVLRIDQDLHPNDDYEIAIDAWVASAEPESLAAVRMWWIDTADSNTRSPFGKGVRRHIDIDYVQVGAGWEIRIKQGGRKKKSYVFDVVLEDGKAVASTSVRSDGEVVEDCKATRSKLVTKKVLGIPTGLRRIDVTCTDADGNQHRGSVASR